jgi:hypothetical protein
MKKCDETPVLPLGDGVPDGRGPATAGGSASPGMHATSPPQPGSRLFSELVVAFTASRSRSSSSTWRSPDCVSKSRTRYVPPFGRIPSSLACLPQRACSAKMAQLIGQRSTKDHLKFAIYAGQGWWSGAGRTAGLPIFSSSPSGRSSTTWHLNAVVAS